LTVLSANFISVVLHFNIESNYIFIPPQSWVGVYLGVIVKFGRVLVCSYILWQILWTTSANLIQVEWNFTHANYIKCSTEKNFENSDQHISELLAIELCVTWASRELLVTFLTKPCIIILLLPVPLYFLSAVIFYKKNNQTVLSNWSHHCSQWHKQRLLKFCLRNW